MDDSLKDQISSLIDQYTGEQLWQQSIRLAVKGNPDIAKEVLGVIQDNKITRNELLDQAFATNTTNSMRLGLRMPAIVEDILCVVDPYNFPMKNGKQGTKIAQKLARAFPEFAIAAKQ
jgi:hypothetical protein